MFCPKCGTNVEDGKAFCPACGNPMAQQQAQPTYNQQVTYTQQPQQAQPQYQAQYQAPRQNGGKSTSMFTTFSLVCGIISIVLAFPFAILWGICVSIPSLLLGAGGLVMAIISNNNGGKANGGFITSIIGLALAFCFTIGCFASSCSACYSNRYDAAAARYLKCGVAGGACTAACDARRGIDSLFDF